MGRMSEQEAMDWTKAATTSNYEIAIEDFAERVRQYIKKTGKRVVFLVDEIGQFISSDSDYAQSTDDDRRTWIPVQRKSMGDCYSTGRH